jgi:hypothetical protein
VPLAVAARAVVRTAPRKLGVLSSRWLSRHHDDGAARAFACVRAGCNADAGVRWYAHLAKIQLPQLAPQQDLRKSHNEEQALHGK